MVLVEFVVGIRRCRWAAQKSKVVSDEMPDGKDASFVNTYVRSYNDSMNTVRFLWTLY